MSVGCNTIKGQDPTECEFIPIYQTPPDSMNKYIGQSRMTRRFLSRLVNMTARDAQFVILPSTLEQIGPHFTYHR